MKVKMLAVLGAAALATLGLAGAAAPAYAVTTVHCPPASNLQAALSNPAVSEVVIYGTCTGNFEISHNVTLIGQSGATLDGNNNGTVLTVDPGVTATLDYLTVQHGKGSSFGDPVGGIDDQGTLTLNNSKVVSNTGEGSAGGIEDVGNGPLNLNNSTVSGNTARGGYGGGIEMFGTATFSNSTFSDNHAPFGGGGGIANDGTLTVNKSTVTTDSAGSGGGGIINYGTMKLNSSAVTHNTTNGANGGGGILNYGTATLSGSQVSQNFSQDQGGGIFNSDTGGITPGQLLLKGSSVTGNSTGSPPGSGGGIYNPDGKVTLESSTVAGNTPDQCVGC